MGISLLTAGFRVSLAGARADDDRDLDRARFLVAAEGGPSPA